MKWDYVLDQLTAVVAADAALAAIFGTAFRYQGVGTFTVPLLEQMLVADSETEQWNPMIVQWSGWTRTMADLLTTERRLRVLFHQELPVTIGEMPMWCQFEDAEPLTSPDRDDVFGRAWRFRVTPLRSLYDPVPPSS